VDISFVKNIISIKDNEDTPPIIKNTRALIAGLYGKYKIIKPSSFKRSIDYYLPKYKNKDQHDAHEFFTDFIDIIDKYTLQATPYNNKPQYMIKNRLFEMWCKDVYQGKTSITRDQYHGSLLVKYTCRSCGNYFYKFEEFSSIILHCKKNSSIYSLLNNYFLEDYAHVKCKDCCNDLSDGVEHEITKVFYTLPKTLCFVINKFQGQDQGEYRDKITAKVQINNKLDICEYLNAQSNSVYKFSSAVIHDGSTPNSGHYYALINENVSQEGKKLNTSIIDDEQAFNYNGDYADLNCYMVFYTLEE
jgi:uncharacterized UBP type Zn finger protein